jgi:hypothetical protein
MPLSDCSSTTLALFTLTFCNLAVFSSTVLVTFLDVSAVTFVLAESAAKDEVLKKQHKHINTAVNVNDDFIRVSLFPYFAGMFLTP